jgi:plasmid maintenance system antidote protein VapI
MISTEELQAARKFCTGYFILERMEQNNLTLPELKQKLNITDIEPENLLNGKTAVSLQTAKQLSEIFTTSEKFWLNIDNTYRNWLNQSNQI